MGFCTGAFYAVDNVGLRTQQFLIKSANCGLLVIILIGIPAVTGARFGHLAVSSATTAQVLILWGLALAVTGNSFAALSFSKTRKLRLLCLEWALIFGSLLGIEIALVHGYLNFNWLKQGLLWLQKQL